MSWLARLQFLEPADLKLFVDEGWLVMMNRFVPETLNDELVRK
jgi:hypothetical protein